MDLLSFDFIKSYSRLGCKEPWESTQSNLMHKAESAPNLTRLLKALSSPVLKAS